MEPKVSIIVPVYNGTKTLPLCIDSLMNLNFPKDDLEIIVVDNNSTDDTKNIIRQYPVKYVFENKRSRGAARNKGIKESNGDVIAFIDADCVADRRWLKEIIKGFDSEVVGGCGGDAISFKPQTLIEKYYDLKNFFSQKKGLMTWELFLPRIATFNAAFRRNVLKEVGLLDDSFITNEDVDLSWRIYLNGYQLKYISKAIVYHKHPDNLSVLFRKWFESGYTYVYLLQKYTNLIKEPLINYNDWIGFFVRLLKSIKTFFITLFTKKDILEKISPIFDIIIDTDFFLGRLYGLIRIRLGIEKIFPLSFPDDKIIWRTVNDETIISIPHKDCHYILNNVGSRIWTLLIEGKEIYEIIDIIVDEHSVDKEEVKNDLVGFIDELKKENLLKYDREKKRQFI